MSKPNNSLKYYLQPPFILCVLVLAAAVVAMPALVERLGVFFIKLPLPLKLSLDEIDKSALAPYEVAFEQKIDNPKIEEALGTDQYIQWELLDTEEAANSPTRMCSLFITYYTGNPDQVPHVPEECYTGGGNQRLGTEDLVINGIPIRRLTFGSKKGNYWSNNQNFNVLYFFSVNGEYAGDRNACRTVLQANLFSKYSYFSKVEWKFYNRTAFGILYPDKEQIKIASEKLLSKLVPVLEENHWPDWEKANQKNDNQ